MKTPDKYLFILDCNEEKNQEDIKQLTIALKLKPTNITPTDNIKYFCFEGNILDYYRLLNSLKKRSSLGDYFSLIDSGIADNLEIEVLPSTIDEKDLWNFSQWRTQGVSKAAEILGGWKAKYLSAPSGVQSEAQGKFSDFETNLTIAGKEYVLRIIALDEDETDKWYRYELTSTTGEKIPTGFKLRLQNHKFEDFENNTQVAEEGTQALTVDVQPEPGEGIIFIIEPLPDNYDPQNYEPQTVWFD